jgi:hypothetical protein
MPQDLTFTEIKLPADRWDRLVELATRPLKKHKNGGFQDRLKAWIAEVQEDGRTIRLAHQPIRKRRFDDMTWVRNSIIRKNKGGWQRHVWSIFVDTHPQFSNLPIMQYPRKKKVN